MTKNFKLHEFEKSKKATELKIDNSVPINRMNEMQKTAELMQEIRNFVGVPVDITSGYRCKEVNTAVGGAENSDHTAAKAVDFRIRGYSEQDHKKLMDLLMKRADVRYMKCYADNRLHISRK